MAFTLVVNRWNFLKLGKFEFQKDIHFKTQPGPVAKNATPRPPFGNRTRDPGSLEQRSTDWAMISRCRELGCEFCIYIIQIFIQMLCLVYLHFGKLVNYKLTHLTQTEALELHFSQLVLPLGLKMYIFLKLEFSLL